MTWGEFFVTLWNAEVFSWDSLVGLLVLAVVAWVVLP